MTARAQRMSVRQTPSSRRVRGGALTYEVFYLNRILARIQQDTSGNGRWFMYGAAASIPNTSNRPDYFDAVKAEALKLCRQWLKEQAQKRGEL